eukprot:7671140-Lingulodinium_polyedra.AAC.1
MAAEQDDAEPRALVGQPGGSGELEARDEAASGPGGPLAPPGAGTVAPRTPSRSARAQPPGEPGFVEPPTFAVLADNAGVDGDPAD